MTKDRSNLLNQLVKHIGYFSRQMHMKHTVPFADVPLSKPHTMILFCIARHKEGVSVKQMAEVLGVTPGAVTQFIDVLVEKNLVKREEDIRDRRKQKLLLTEFAREHFPKFKKDYFSSVSSLFEALTDEELTQLLILLEKVTSTPTKEH